MSARRLTLDDEDAIARAAEAMRGTRASSATELETRQLKDAAIAVAALAGGSNGSRIISSLRMGDWPWRFVWVRTWCAGRRQRWRLWAVNGHGERRVVGITTEARPSWRMRRVTDDEKNCFHSIVYPNGQGCGGKRSSPPVPVRFDAEKARADIEARLTLEWASWKIRMFEMRRA